jgi:hypothetical protein
LRCHRAQAAWLAAKHTRSATDQQPRRRIFNLREWETRRHSVAGAGEDKGNWRAREESSTNQRVGGLDACPG